MNEHEIDKLSHKINEIFFVNNFKEDDIINILLQCTLKIVIMPRYELISFIDI